METLPPCVFSDPSTFIACQTEKICIDFEYDWDQHNMGIDNADAESRTVTFAAPGLYELSGPPGVFYAPGNWYVSDHPNSGLDCEPIDSNTDNVESPN